MADTAAQYSPAAEAPAKSAKVKKEKKAKTPKAKPSHPPTSEMVGKAIKDLKERGGSPLQAIKKYIAANYKVDADKMAPFIRKYLKSAVASGSLVQTKGKGVSGSFRLASGSVQVGGGDKKPAAKKVKRAVAGDRPKAAAAAKKPATKPKKAHSSPKAKKPVGAGARKKSASAAAKHKSQSKTKKAKAGPTEKPKAPKPKTAKKKAAASHKKK